MSQNPIRNRIIKASKDFKEANGRLPSMDDLKAIIGFVPEAIKKHLGEEVPVWVDIPVDPSERDEQDKKSEPTLPPPTLPLPVPMPQPQAAEGYVPIDRRINWSSLIVHGPIERIGTQDLLLKPVFVPPTLEVAWCMNPSMHPTHPDWFLYTQELGYVPVEPMDVSHNKAQAEDQGKICLQAWMPATVYGKTLVGVGPYVLVVIPKYIHQQRQLALVEKINRWGQDAIVKAAERAAEDERNPGVHPEQLYDATADMGNEVVSTGIARASGKNSDDASPV